MSKFRLLIAVLAITAGSVALAPTTALGDEPGAPVKLNGPLDGQSVLTFRIVGGGDFVMYSFRDSNFDWQAYSVPIGGGEVFKLNPPGSEIHKLLPVSVDSDVVVFTTGTHFTNEETWAVDVRKNKRTFIADGPGNETLDHDVELSPDGKWVVLRPWETGDPMTLYPTSGGPGVEIVSDGRVMYFSPNSKYLIYSEWQDGEDRMFSYRISNRERSALGPWGGSLYVPATAIAPDSSAVVFYMDDKLRSASLDGTNKTVLWSGQNNSEIRDVEINASGNRVVYRDEDSALRSAQIGVGGSSIVLVPTDLDPLQPSLSPDGKWAVVRTNDGLTSVRVKGGNLHQLEGSLRRISPDSGTVLISYTGGGEEELASMPINGGAVEPLVTAWTHNATLEGAVFYPLGGDVLYKAEHGDGANLFRVTLAGGEAQQLNVPGIDRGIYSFNPAISPDGRYVVYMGGNQNHEQHRLYSVEIGYRCQGQPATMVGTPESDDLVGTKKQDVIVAMGGADDISARRGSDLICAGAGEDTVNGGPGGDIIYGGKGPDSLLGGDGDDIIRGGDGSDGIFGEKGDDQLRGGNGHDELSGGRADDLLVGGDGDDDCSGGIGTDLTQSCEMISGVP